MFWNNVKLHGIKTAVITGIGVMKFWNNDKLHGIKTLQPTTQ